MQARTRTRTVTLTALLIAIGIVIPMISPFKMILEPASFTLASHVATMIAMFISPPVAIMVSIGTAFGFLLGGFPIVIVLRAATHILFASLGAQYLSKNQDIWTNPKKRWLFNFGLGVIHAVAEVVVVMAFYFAGTLTTGFYEQGMLISVFGLVGVGTIIHSMVDFWIAEEIWKRIGAKF